MLKNIKHLAAMIVVLGAVAAAHAIDSDGDGVDDAIDVCNNTPPGVAVDSEGRPLGDIDRDCDTDLDDFTLFQQGFTGPMSPLPPDGMAVIPGGEYEMGCHEEPNSCLSDELPVHTVYVDPFYIDKREVTNQQYVAALNWAWSQGGLIAVSTAGVVHKLGDLNTPYCDTTDSSSYSRVIWNDQSCMFSTDPNHESHPIPVVSWFGAAAYSNWRSAMEGRTPSYNTDTWECDFAATGYRLPTEAEWEKAARGGMHCPYQRYPWGDVVEGTIANYWESGDPYELGHDLSTTPVGFYTGELHYRVDFGWPGSQDSYQTSDGMNGYGLYDMAGNVWEWCHDRYSATYYQNYVDAGSPPNPHGPDTGGERVERGGSWHDFDFLRCARRTGFPPARLASHQGFRLVLD